MDATSELQSLLPHWDILVKDGSATGRIRVKLTGVENLCLDRKLIAASEIAKDSVLAIVANEVSNTYPELISELGRRFTERHLENVGYFKEAAVYRSVRDTVLSNSYAEEWLELSFNRQDKIVTAIWRSSVVINGVPSTVDTRFLCRSFETSALLEVLRELIPQVRSGRVVSGETQKAA